MPMYIKDMIASVLFENLQVRLVFLFIAMVFNIFAFIFFDLITLRACNHTKSCNLTGTLNILRV